LPAKEGVASGGAYGWWVRKVGGDELE